MPHRERQRALSVRGFSDDRYADAFFMDSPDPIAYVGPNDEFIAVNSALTQFLGYTESEMLGKSWQDFTSASDIPGDEDEVRKLLSDPNGWGYSMLKKYRRKDGRLVWINLHVRVIRDQETSQVEHFISYLIPLHGAGQYKAEKEKSTGTVTVRPAISWTTFLRDNPKFAAALVVVVLLSLSDFLKANVEWFMGVLKGIAGGGK